MNPVPSLGLPVVHLVDGEDIVRDALAWLLRAWRLLSLSVVAAVRRGRDEIQRACSDG